MIVLLDVGNSRIKLGWYHPSLGRETAVHAIALEPLTQLPELVHKWLASLPVQAREALGVNVAGAEVAERLENAFLSTGCKVIWNTPVALQLDVHNGYDKPEQLGADRWAALLGLAGHFPGTHPPLVLATFGTATTIDTLSPANHFEGGLILPGPALMRQSLAKGTANLPLASGLGSDYPTHTLQAISTGVVAAQMGAVWRQCEIARKHFGLEPILCVSGGGWLEVEQEVRGMMGSTEIHVIPNPVLDGLARILLGV
ncbi:type III pantothenate kinase [Zwartia sp.]|uniref:type III pantothenate kinase n=1 Tax=Zwartia sp. TaxID=2978004 RepID=UPI00271F40A0|nr:type III pantothenate kinase [Zwartia sp.]MDO9024979.1 type III pantothenate kinase [Zwartia sp.]